MSLRFSRLFSTRTRTLGVWSEFTNRSSSLKIADPRLKKDLFQAIDLTGPTSVAHQEFRAAYHSPLHIDETFKIAYEILEKDAEKTYASIAERKDSLSAPELEKLLAAAEKLNPEVLYNTRFSPESVDRSQPVYRQFLQKKWEEYALMVTMQRLEQLSVIPDTLPTLEPKVDVRVQFGHNSLAEFGDWIIPGTRLPAFAVSKPPTIEIQEFDSSDHPSGLYSVVVVNPDVPDLETNSYKTSLNYGLFNVPLNYVDNTISPAKLLANPQWTFQQYVPLLPEKNIPSQRACLWVFRQPEEMKEMRKYDEQNFDIRAFTKQNDLTAVGAHVWRQDFDRSVGKIREEYGLPQGKVFHRVRGTQPLL